MKLEIKKQILRAMTLASLATASNLIAQDEMEYKSAVEKVSYYQGSQYATHFKQQATQMGLDPDIFIKAFSETIEGKNKSISEEDVRSAVQRLQAESSKKEKALGEKNLAEGIAFLEELAKKEGVVKTESGLLYEVLKKGGERKYTPPKGDTTAPRNVQFMVHYKGTLIDGTEFDASPEGQPIPMTLNVVPGFKEALLGMTVGSKWKIYLKPELAYGDRRRSPEIGPNSTLIFEIDLVDIKEPGVSAPVQVPPPAKK